MDQTDPTDKSRPFIYLYVHRKAYITIGFFFFHNRILPVGAADRVLVNIVSDLALCQA